MQFPEDIAGHIIRHFFTSDLADSYGKQLQTFALINKNNGALVSAIPKDIKAMRQLIEVASDYFPCSNEKIAKSLPWKSVREIMKMQDEVVALCHRPLDAFYNPTTMKIASSKRCDINCKTYHCKCNSKLLEIASQERSLECLKQENDHSKNIHTYLLQFLCNEGANLNFTYGENCETPFIGLCWAFSYAENDSVIRELLKFFVEQHKKGLVDLNKVRKDGKSGFMISWIDPGTTWVGKCFFRTNSPRFRNFDCAEDDIKLININQQDNDGNAALMHYLSIPSVIIQDSIVEDFIKSGADAKLANNEGLTPLEFLQTQSDGLRLCDVDYIKALIDAIEKEKSQQQKN